MSIETATTDTPAINSTPLPAPARPDGGRWATAEEIRATMRANAERGHYVCARCGQVKQEVYSWCFVAAMGETWCFGCVKQYAAERDAGERTKS